MVVRITKETRAHTADKRLRESMLDIEGGDAAGAGGGCRSAHGGREELIISREKCGSCRFFVRVLGINRSGPI